MAVAMTTCPIAAPPAGALSAAAVRAVSVETIGL
jgi:hypothetical protein